MDTTQTVSPATAIRLELKPERVQDELAATTPAPSNAILTFELTLYSPQPVTAEIGEAKVAILIHKNQEA
jgi:hypothetical protein